MMQSTIQELTAIILNPWLALIVGLALLFLIIIFTLRSRYMVFPPNVYVMHMRKGKVRTSSYGGAFFKFPLIDQYRLLPTTIQRIEIKASEKVISKENQEIIVRGFLVWRVENAEAAFKKISGMDASPKTSSSSLNEINKKLELLAESVIRTTVANMSLDEILRNRSRIVDALMKEFAQVVATWGISIETVEIKDVELFNQDLFKNLQAEFENTKNLEAEQIRIQTDLEITKAKADANKQERLFQAQQEEIAKVREIEKEQKIIEQEKNLRLAKERLEQEVGVASELREQQIGIAERKKTIELIDQEKSLEVGEQEKDRAIGIAKRLKELEFIEQEKNIESKRKEKELLVMQLEQKRELELADYQQKQQTIHAETELIRQTKLAQAEAESRRLQIELQAKATKVKFQEEALGQADALKLQIETEAAARAQAMRIQAEAEAQRIKSIAEAKKLDMISEAEGTRQKLLADAEGLAKKVQAQNTISEQVLQFQTMENVIRSISSVLPEIAKQMIIGDVKWINMGNDGSNNGNNSPLGIIPKNIMQLMTIMNGMGIDLSSFLNHMINKSFFNNHVVNDNNIGFNSNDGNNKDIEKPDKTTNTETESLNIKQAITPELIISTQPSIDKTGKKKKSL